MRRLRNGKRAIPLVMAVIFWPGFTNADQLSDSGVSDPEIRIGNIMPYTGGARNLDRPNFRNSTIVKIRGFVRAVSFKG